MDHRTEAVSPVNPLATRAQIDAERALPRIERSEPVLIVRETIRRTLLADPGAELLDGRQSLDRVLDQWIRFYALNQLTIDRDEPAFLWIADNTPRRWFGHVFDGDCIAGDNPDNTNRSTYLDGESAYVLAGRYGTPRAGQFSLNLEVAHPQAIGLGRNLATLTDKMIVLEADGSFVVTIDPQPANGRANHMRSEPGLLTITARDSRSDWAQVATTLSLTRLSGPGLSARAEDENGRIAAIAAGLPAFVDAWRSFKDGFFGFPEINRIALPKRRDSEGGWGFIGGGRFRLEEDEALIVTTDDAGADYTGFQLTDPWTLRPETVLRTTSLNRTQAVPDADGRYTYVIARQDPGVANWLDTGGLREGWMQLRWQNVPPGRDPGASQPKRVRLDDLETALPDGVRRADLAYRRAQIRSRVVGMALRTVETPFL